MPKTLSQEELIGIGNQHGYKGKYIFIRHKCVASFINGLTEKRGLKNVLNVGCGLGIMEQFIKTPINMLGIDVDTKAIKIARALARRSGKDYAYMTGSIQSLGKGKYDLIIISEVLEHVEDDKGMLLSLKSLLSKKGVIVLSVPNLWQPRNILRKMLFMKLKIMDKTHLREYSSRSIENLIEECGFRIIGRKVSVLYFPLESYIKRAIPEDSGIRRALLKAFPRLASHFIYAIK